MTITCWIGRDPAHLVTDNVYYVNLICYSRHHPWHHNVNNPHSDNRVTRRDAPICIMLLIYGVHEHLHMACSKNREEYEAVDILSVESRDKKPGAEHRVSNGAHRAVRSDFVSYSPPDRSRLLLHEQR